MRDVELRREGAEAEEHRSEQMAYFSKDVDWFARIGVHGRRGRRVCSPFHQLRPVGDRPAGERVRRLELHVVRVLRHFGEQDVQGADTLDKEKFHGERADRLQQHRECLRLAFGRMLGLLFTKELRDLSEQKSPRARGRHELLGRPDRCQVLRPEQRRTHGR